MKSVANNYLSNRILKLNVGFLLSAGPGNKQDSDLDIPEPIKVADDLILHYIRGGLRLSRAKEGILVQADLNVGCDNACSWCMDDVQQDVALHLEELYTMNKHHSTEFSIQADGILDLNPLIRAETIIQTSNPVTFHPEKTGVCDHCHLTIEEITGKQQQDEIDPRMARLKELLDSQK